MIPLVTAITAALLAIIISISAVGGKSTPHFLPAIVLGLTGVILRIAAIRTLGPLFRDSIDLAFDHIHVKSGPYRFLKHPAEVGFLLAMSGLFLLAPTAITFGILCLLGSLSFLRMHLENQMLNHHFQLKQKSPWPDGASGN